LSFGEYPLINKPTTVKNTIADLIDNIFINDLGKVETMSAIVCDISDHYQIFHITKTSVEICDPNIIKKRQFNDKGISQSTHVIGLNYI
jgi:hypothetical protein